MAQMPYLLPGDDHGNTMSKISGRAFGIFIPPLQRSGWYIMFALSVRACVRPSVRACVHASEQFPEHISHVFSHIVMKLSIRVLVWKVVCHVP